MVETVGRRAIDRPHEAVEDRATLAATALLSALVVAGLTAWGVLRGVALPIDSSIRLGAFVIGGGIAFGCLIYRPQRRRWWRNTALVLALATSIVGVDVLPSHIERELRAHEQALEDVAVARMRQDPSGISGCVASSPPLSVGDLGPFESICVIGIAPRFAVVFEHREDMTHIDGLVFAPGADPIRPTATCLQHLYGPWFEFVGPDPSCPFGFDPTGGG